MSPSQKQRRSKTGAFLPPAALAAPAKAPADAPVTGPTVRVTLPGGKALKVPRGTPAIEVLKQIEPTSKYPMVAARFRNKVTSLTRPLDKPGELEGVHLDSADGNMIYSRSLTFVLIRAVGELFPGLRVHINHSLNRGYYAELYQKDGILGDVIPLNEKDVKAIARRMRDIIAHDEPIVREEHSVEKAIALFRAAGHMDKVELLKYAPPGSVSVYRLGGEVNHFYGQLAPSTGCLKVFELVAELPGLVLRFPDAAKPYEIPGHQTYEKMREVLREYEQWMRVLDWRTVAQLNALIDSNRVREYVLIAEALHEKRIAGIADMIRNHPRRPRIVLLSGPSSSGKTTSTKRLALQLRVLGYRPVVIELDDFFVDREKTPKDATGEYDFEALQAIDIPRLQDCVRRLLKGEQVRLPKFSFKEGRSLDGQTVVLGEKDLLILEGIHALNDELMPAIPDGLKFKIYASPLTHLNIDDHNRISSSDARLIRRLVRDFNHRGYDAVDTIRRWPSVRRGERRNIFPYQENADVIFNSALPYELAALKPYALPVLSRVKPTAPEYAEAARLVKFLGYFRPLDHEFVPRHSLLREFIGGSCFTY